VNKPGSGLELVAEHAVYRAELSARSKFYNTSPANLDLGLIGADLHVNGKRVLQR